MDMLRNPGNKTAPDESIYGIAFPGDQHLSSLKEVQKDPGRKTGLSLID
jgi:hypothetical protein